MILNKHKNPRVLNVVLLITTPGSFFSFTVCLGWSRSYAITADPSCMVSSEIRVRAPDSLRPNWGVLRWIPTGRRSRNITPPS